MEKKYIYVWIESETYDWELIDRGNQKDEEVDLYTAMGS